MLHAAQAKLYAARGALAEAEELYRCSLSRLDAEGAAPGGADIAEALLYIATRCKARRGRERAGQGARRPAHARTKHTRAHAQQAGQWLGA